MTSRRLFLLRSALLLPATYSLSDIVAKPKPTAAKPLVISTWDSGVIANSAAWPILARGGRCLDAVEQAGIAIENDINCCVGLGGNPDRDGHVTLDSCIMDEHLNIGAVAALERIKHPVSVARKVMELTPHVFLVGEGAQQFALANGFKLEPETLSPDAQKAYREWLKKSEYKPQLNIERTQLKKTPAAPVQAAPKKLPNGQLNHDTMGTLVLDQSGNLSGMCTTSGMAFKMRGRVGDSPIIGAGLYVDNEVGAATASGHGEEMIRVSGSHTVVEAMRSGLSPLEACKRAVERIYRINPERAKTIQAGFIAINKAGETGAYAMQPGFNYTLSNANKQNEVLMADSLLKA